MMIDYEALILYTIFENKKIERRLDYGIKRNKNRSEFISGFRW